MPKATITLLLAFLVLWLFYDRVIAAPGVRAPDHAAEVGQQSPAESVPTVAEIAAAFPQERIDALLAESATAVASNAHVTVVASATVPRNTLDPGRMFRWAPLSVTVEKVLGNDRLNPRQTVLAAEARKRLDELVEVYQRHLRAAYDAEGVERHRQMMARIASGSVPTADGLQSELSADDLAAIAAQLQAHPAASDEEREHRRQRLLRDAVMKKWRPDAFTVFPDGTAYVAKRGELAASLGSFQDYRAFLVQSFYATTVAFLASAVGLHVQEVDALLLHFEQLG